MGCRQGPFHAFAWLKLRLEPQPLGLHGRFPPLRLSALLQSQPAKPDPLAGRGTGDGGDAGRSIGQRHVRQPRRHSSPAKPSAATARTNPMCKCCLPVYGRPRRLAKAVWMPYISCTPIVARAPIVARGVLL